MTITPIRLLSGLAALAVIFAVGFWAGDTARNREADPPAILKDVQALSELATVKYVMSKVVTHEIEKTFGKDKVLLIATGAVKAGIDLGKMTAGDIRVGQKVISFHLPKAEVIDSFLDEKQTFVYDRSTGFLITPEKSLESEARRIAIGAMLTGAQAGGIHKEADNRARNLITQLFLMSGFERVEFH